MIDLHNKEVPPADEETLQLMRDRMYAFIFPNNPRTEQEKIAFETAVQYQYAHDATAAIALAEVPQGVKSFNIGDFSMAFDEGWIESRLTRKTICPSAYGILLRHGLLYRGVEGRGCEC